MKIAIIGAGGVGGFFGGKLAKAGFDVHFLARGAHLQAMLQNGLQIKSVDGDFQVNDIKATDKIEEIGKADCIILGVKAWQVPEIREDLKTIIHAETMILPLQNGVLASDELIESIDPRHVLGGLCRIISMIEAPGVIDHFGINPLITFGERDGSHSERTEKLKSVFEQAGIDCKLTNNIQRELWKKFISICVSGLLAITQTNYGQLRKIKETREMMIRLLKEIILLSQKAGINIESGYLDKTLAFIDAYPYESTASLTRDVWEGKPTELEYQNGTVVRLAGKYGVDTPINQFVYNCLLPRELKAREMNMETYDGLFRK